MVKTVQVRGNCKLMFSCKSERYVFETVGMASNLFEDTMFCLESHSPCMDKRAKLANQSRIVLQKMMFREKTVVGEKGLGISGDVHQF